jgi:uncharacterized repeat protein (TIGR02543 family)
MLFYFWRNERRLMKEISKNGKRSAVRKRFSILLSLIVFFAVLFPVPVQAVPAPLVLQGAAVTSGGGVGLTFDRALSGVDFVNRIKDGFTIIGLDRTLPIMNATLHGGSNNFVQLYFDEPVRGGEAVALIYVPGSVQASDGGLLAPIASMDIENNMPHPLLVPGMPPPLVVGTPFAHTLGATGGTAPYRFSLDSGNLPSGLTMGENGTISGTPTQAGIFQFAVLVRDAAEALDLQQFIVPVLETSADVCEITGIRYPTLDAALSSVPPGGTALIRLLKDIEYQGGIFIEGQAITFDLNGHKLDVVNSAPGGFGLSVQSGGSVDLSGSGELNVTGDTYGVRVSTNALHTRATVTSAAATGFTGEATYAAGTNAVLTVLGDCTVSQGNNPCVHAISDAKIHVGGNVNAWNQGVYASDAVITVAGSVTAGGTNVLEEPVGIGAGVYSGSVTIGGNVTANRIGVMARANGTVTAEGIITAPEYIQFSDDAAVSAGDFVTPTTRTGYRTYTDEGSGTVWVKEPPAEYLLTVYDSFAPVTGAGSYREGTAVRIHAGARPGSVFTGWTSPEVMPDEPHSADTGFLMPGKAVNITANWKKETPDAGADNTSVRLEKINAGTEMTLTAGQNAVYFIPDGASASNAEIAYCDMEIPDTGYATLSDARERQRFAGGQPQELRSFSWGGVLYTVWHVFFVDNTETCKYIYVSHNTARTVTFNPNGGSCDVKSLKTDENGYLNAEPSASRSGYRFGGWFLSSSAGEKIGVGTKFDADKTVYAHWIRISADTAYGGSGSGGGSSVTGSGWNRDAKGWRYRNPDGGYVVNRWLRVNGAWYHFSSSGYMQTGWIFENGKWYYLDPETGAMRTGLLRAPDGYLYYFRPDGSMEAGNVTVDGRLRHFNDREPSEPTYVLDAESGTWKPSGNTELPYGASTEQQL